MELLILPQMKFENISQLSLIILVGISEYWDVLFSFNRLISVSICLKMTSLKLKTPFILHLVLIAKILGWFLYLRTAFKVGYLTFSSIGSKSEYWKMLKFFTISTKQCSCFHNFTIVTQIFTPFSGIEFFGKWRLNCFPKKFFIRNFSFI